MSGLRRMVRDVPDASLKFIVATMESDGAKVTTTNQGGGLWTVIGVFPDHAGTPLAPLDEAMNEQTDTSVPLETDRARDIDVLARTIWGEARGGSRKGMEAVAAVVLNRRERNMPNRFGATIAEVCLKNLQFSCWNRDDPNREKLMRVDESNSEFLVCLDIATRAARGDLQDPTEGSDHYHRVGISPDWARGRTPVKRIDAHVFFNDIK